MEESRLYYTRGTRSFILLSRIDEPDATSVITESKRTKKLN